MIFIENKYYKLYKISHSYWTTGTYTYILANTYSNFHKNKVIDK